MLLVDFPPGNLPKVEEIGKYSVHFMSRDSDDNEDHTFNLDWIEDCGLTFCVIPCEDGLVIIQWYGVHATVPYNVREIGR